MVLSPIALLAIVNALLCLAYARVLISEARQADEIAARLRAIQDGPVPGARPVARGGGMLLGALRWIGEVLRDRAILSAKDLLDLERTVAAAGYNPPRAVATFIGIKAMLFVLMPAAGFSLATLCGSDNPFAWTIGAVILGLLGPNWILGFVRRSHFAALRRGLPDALDLLVVCAEAGVGPRFPGERGGGGVAGAQPAR